MNDGPGGEGYLGEFRFLPLTFASSFRLTFEALELTSPSSFSLSSQLITCSSTRSLSFFTVPISTLLTLSIIHLTATSPPKSTLEHGAFSPEHLLSSRLVPRWVWNSRDERSSRRVRTGGMSRESDVPFSSSFGSRADFDSASPSSRSFQRAQRVSSRLSLVHPSPSSLASAEFSSTLSF